MSFAPFLLSGVEIGLGLLVLGVIALAGKLLAPRPKGPIADKEPTNLAQRGVFIPLIIGRRDTGPSFQWAGDRETKTEGGSGGKGGGGDEEPEQTIYWEAAWHALGIGPGAALHRIWYGGKLIMDVTLTPGTHPSGSNIDLGSEGGFAIYWGEANQPVNAFLAAPSRVGISSRWPRVMYVLWNKKRLGPSPRWDLMKYDVEFAPQGTVNTTGASYTSAPGGVDGYSPMHILEQVLFSPYPYGLGNSRDLVDWAQWNRVADQLRTEGMHCSFIARDGETAEQALTEFMADMGMGLPTVNGLAYPVLIRPPALDQPIITEDLLLSPIPEIRNDLAPRRTDRLTFEVRDRLRGFAQNVIPVSDGGQQNALGAVRSRTVAIQTTVNYVTGAAIADRRAQEELATPVPVNIVAARGSREIIPGTTIVAHRVPFILRVLSVRPHPTSGRVDVETILDYYGSTTGFIPVSGFVAPPPPPPAGPPDVSVGPSQGHGPEFLLTGTISVSVAWVRPNIQTTDAEIHASTDGTTYQLLGFDSHRSWGGKLIDPLPADDPWEIDVGPRYTASGPDEGLALDLSATPTQWRLGRQICAINGELFFLARIEAVSAGVYRLRGLMRARLGTKRAAHAINDSVLITLSQGLVGWSDPSFVPGALLRIKVRPRYGSTSPSLASITAKTITLPRPIPYGPVNVRTDRIRGRRGVYSPVSGLTLHWEYFAINQLFPRSGAGLQGYGEAVAAFPPPMGVFEVQIKNGIGDVMFPPTVIASGWNLTSAQIVIYFGTFPLELFVEMREVVGSGATPWTAVVTAAKQE